MTKIIRIPKISVVMLMGVPGSGKSTFANKYFKQSEILSSDYFRELISDNKYNQTVSGKAFNTLYYVLERRLEVGKLSVIDATNLRKDDRKRILDIARHQNCGVTLIVFNTNKNVCIDRIKNRQNFYMTAEKFNRQYTNYKMSTSQVKKEGFLDIHTLTGDEVDNVEFERYSTKHDLSHIKDVSFDIIGDVHGCYNELCELLEKLNYEVDKNNFIVNAPTDRKLVFVGDLCDRGNKNIEVLRLVMNIVSEGDGYCVLGNHDAKLLKKLKGSDIQVDNGIDITIKQLEEESDIFKCAVKNFLSELHGYYIFDNDKLVISHAGIKEEFINRSSVRIDKFCMYGDVDGTKDENGLPVCYPWQNDYKGRSMIVFGHTPKLEVEIVNNTYCIDTGVCFGNKLSAISYPSKEVTSVKAKETYCKHPDFNPNNTDPDLLDIDNLFNKDMIVTRYGNVKIKARNIPGALELESRFAVDPKWLIYIPPTMSPCKTSLLDDYLEYPMDAFEYYKSNGIDKVICEEKHMGSRAVIIVANDKKVIKNRFNIYDDSIGVIYTRRGNPFFTDTKVEQEILNRLNNVLTQNNFWKDFDTNWVCLDVEIMPWNGKAEGLIQKQYAPTACAGQNGINAVLNSIEGAINNFDNKPWIENNNCVNLDNLLNDYQDRYKAQTLFSKSYQNYCWSVDNIEDYKIAPFHILATEGKTYFNTDHSYQMSMIDKYICGVDNIFIKTNYKFVDISDDENIFEAINWWKSITENGEGMVVKPYDFIAYDQNTNMIQPAVKCRGREYLRIIYGAEYLLGENLNRLKKRSLSKKQDLALNEFSLGMESLERFVDKESFDRVHECAFGVLALETESTDPRL
jgi:polynucleotide kinase-phosphatase